MASLVVFDSCGFVAPTLPDDLITYDSATCSPIVSVYDAIAEQFFKDMANAGVYLNSKEKTAYNVLIIALKAYYIPFEPFDYTVLADGKTITADFLTDKELSHIITGGQSYNSGDWLKDYASDTLTMNMLDFYAGQVVTFVFKSRVGGSSS